MPSASVLQMLVNKLQYLQMHSNFGSEGLLASGRQHNPAAQGGMGVMSQPYGGMQVIRTDYMPMSLTAPRASWPVPPALASTQYCSQGALHGGDGSACCVRLQGGLPCNLSLLPHASQH